MLDCITEIIDALCMFFFMDYAFSTSSYSVNCCMQRMVVLSGRWANDVPAL
jgi:hypothetical protein